jgi:hypothetical protein
VVAIDAGGDSGFGVLQPASRPEPATAMASTADRGKRNEKGARIP